MSKFLAALFLVAYNLAVEASAAETSALYVINSNNINASVAKI